MHDHSAKEKRFCVLMKEWCTRGWTPGMGKGEDGFPIEGACKAWQPVAVFDKTKNQTYDVFDCSIFAWGPDLMTEVAKEVSHATASTDKVANEVYKHRRSFIAALNPEIQTRAFLPPPEKDTNGSQGPD